MKLHTRLLSVSLSALALGPAALAQRPFVTATDPGLPGMFGAQMEVIGDINGDGIPDFAVAAPAKNVGVTPGSPLSGNSAGQITAVLGVDTRVVPLGATGVAWLANGTGGWAPCSGSSGTVGSTLGTSMIAIGDRNGDGISELVAGAPFFSTTDAAGNCVAADLGQVQVLNGINGVPLNTFNGGNSGDRYGRIVVALPDFISLLGGVPDGLPEYLVVGNGFADIRDGATDGILFPNIPVSIPGSVACAAGDFDLDGTAMDIAFPESGNVTVFDLSQAAVIATVSGPLMSDFGSALEFVPSVANGPTGFLIGATGDNGGDGGVYFAAARAIGGGTVPTIAPLLIKQGTAGSNERIGASLDFGGAAEADGLLNDIVIGSSNGNSMAIASLDGRDLGTADQLTNATSGANVVRWAGNVAPVPAGAPAPLGSQFTQILAGFRTTPGGAGVIDLLAGGPENNVAQVIGAGCNPAVGVIPVLSQSGPNFAPGVTSSFVVQGAPANMPLTLLVGLPSASPIPFDADLGPGVAICNLGVGLVISTFATNSNGSPLTSPNGFWSTPGIPIPGTALLGLTFAFQAVLTDIPNAQLVTSNTLSVAIGW